MKGRMKGKLRIEIFFKGLASCDLDCKIHNRPSNSQRFTKRRKKTWNSLFNINASSQLQKNMNLEKINSIFYGLTLKIEDQGTIVVYYKKLLNHIILFY